MASIEHASDSAARDAWWTPASPGRMPVPRAPRAARRVAGSRTVIRILPLAAPPAPVEALRTPLRDWVVVRNARRDTLVPKRDIQLVEARGNYALLYTTGARHMLRATMAALELRLEAWGFARIHRSAIVNVAFVREIVCRRTGDRVVVMHDGRRLRFSRHFHERFDERLR